MAGLPAPGPHPRAGRRLYRPELPHPALTAARRRLCRSSPAAALERDAEKLNRPDYLDRFGSLPHTRQWCAACFDWYHIEHRHSGIGYHTPYDVHHGEADLVRDLRAKVLADAYDQHPERFVRKFPEPPAIPEQAWINRPTDDETAEKEIRTQN
ncbi:hypothetical protein BOQ63_000770 (plasmid) [Streptomyces viridifaciens]|nr:hypothetical protein BOQ63_000770 [Streptomyces viridifaciens]